MIKKWLSVLLACCMLFTLAPSIVLADDAASLVVGSGTVEEDADTIVPITVSLKNNPGVISLAFEVTFPNDALELTAIPEVAAQFPFTEGVDNTKLQSPYLLDLGDASVQTNITDDLVVATFNFKVKAGTAPGDYEVSIDASSQDNYDETLVDAVEFAVVPGKVTVTAKPGDDTPAPGDDTPTPGDDTPTPGDDTPTPGGDTPAPAPIDAASLVVGSGTVEEGVDTIVPITVSLKNNPGVISLAFEVTFPNDALELTAIPEVAAQFPFTEGVDNTKLQSPYLLDLGDASVQTNITDDLVVATFNFKVKAGTAPGDYEVSIDASSQDNYDETLGDAVEFAVVPGKVTVTAKPGDDTPTPGGEEPTPGDEPTPIRVTYSVEPSEGGTVDVEESVLPGADLKITVNENDDYTLKELTANGTAVTGDTYKVPEDATAVEVKATFEKKSGNDDNPGGSTDDNPGGNTDQPGDNTGDNTSSGGGGGCYIATSVYGSYDCPQVWTLRRFRDDVLGQTWYGRLFIKAYYATSPTLVRWFGETEWFQNFWRNALDGMVENLQDDGFESTPYQDQEW